MVTLQLDGIDYEVLEYSEINRSALIALPGVGPQQMGFANPNPRMRINISDPRVYVSLAQPDWLRRAWIEPDPAPRREEPQVVAFNGHQVVFDRQIEDRVFNMNEVLQQAQLQNFNWPVDEQAPIPFPEVARAPRGFARVQAMIDDPNDPPVDADFSD